MGRVAGWAHRLGDGPSCVLPPTFFVLRFIRMSSLRWSVTGVYSCIQLFFKGVTRC